MTTCLPCRATRKACLLEGAYRIPVHTGDLRHRSDGDFNFPNRGALQELVARSQVLPDGHPDVLNGLLLGRPPATSSREARGTETLYPSSLRKSADPGTSSFSIDSRLEAPPIRRRATWRSPWKSCWRETSAPRGWAPDQPCQESAPYGADPLATAQTLAPAALLRQRELPNSRK